MTSFFLLGLTVVKVVHKIQHVLTRMNHRRLEMRVELHGDVARRSHNTALVSAHTNVPAVPAQLGTHHLPLPLNVLAELFTPFLKG